MIRRLLAFCLCLALCAPLSAQAADRLIAVGDLHGDYEAYIDILETAGLIDARGKWSGGDDVLVQTGDVADRGPDSLKIIEHLMKLQKRARRKGGEVITLVGNHEALNVTGDLRYVHPGEFAAFVTSKSRRLREATFAANADALGEFYRREDPSLTDEQVRTKWFVQTPLGKLEHQAAWSPDGKIGKWVSKNPVIAKIDGTLFLHGGLSAAHSRTSIAELNARARTALSARETDIESVIHDPTGPLWYRGLVRGRAPATQGVVMAANPSEGALPKPKPLDPEMEVAMVLAQTGTQRIVVGHTPSISGIRDSYGGRLIQIDTGASAHYGGTRSFLRIEGGRVFAHDGDQVREIQGRVR